jgi:hypothetical protein
VLRYSFVPVVVLALASACSWPPAGLLGGPPSPQQATDAIGDQTQGLPPTRLPEAELPRAPQVSPPTLGVPSGRGGSLLR